VTTLRDRILGLWGLHIADPDLANVFSTEHVPPADPSAGPQRLTLHVPFQMSRLHLGQGNGDCHSDTGIVGTTEMHIGWEVKGGPGGRTDAGGGGHGAPDAHGTPAADPHGGGHGTPPADPHGGGHGTPPADPHGGGHDTPPPDPHGGGNGHDAGADGGGHGGGDAHGGGGDGHGGGGHGGGHGPPAGPKTVETLGLSPAFEHLTQDGCPGSATGYSLVTDGRAYYESELQHYFTSSEGDVIFHAEAATNTVLQSDDGVVELNGGSSVSLRAHANIHFTSGEFEAQKPDYFADYHVHEHEAAHGIAMSDVHKTADRATYALEILTTGIRPLKEPLPDAPGPHRGAFKHVFASHAVAWVNLISTAFHPKNGNVHLGAKGDMSLGGGVIASLFGVIASEVIGTLGASVIGTVAAIKGYAFALVFGGVESTFTAMNAVKIAAGEKVEIQSLRGTSIVGDQAVRLAAGKMAQIDGNHVCLSGHNCFVGAGSSFALHGDDYQLELRKVGDAKKFNNPGVSDRLAAGIWRSDIHFTAEKDVELRMTSMQATMESKGKHVKLSMSGIDASDKVEFET
jgi:hypothetical protein